MAYEQFANKASTTLAANIASGDTTLTVSSSANFPTVPNFRILIESEILLVTAVSGTTFTITRGKEGTTAASHVAGKPIDHILTAESLKQLQIDSLDHSICKGRLTLGTTAVPTADVTGASANTLYFRAFQGNQVSLRSSSGNWNIYTYASDLSQSLSGLTANTNYDIYVYDSGGGVLVLSTVAWTGDTARSATIYPTLVDGVYVQSTDNTRRYLGTIRIGATGGQSEDSLLRRFVWNRNNQIERKLKVTEPASTWNYMTPTYRNFNNNSANKVEVIVGLSERLTILVAIGSSNQSSVVLRVIAIGYDQPTSGGTGIDDLRYGNNLAGTTGHVVCLNHLTDIGYHWYSPLEWSNTGGTTIWSGNNISGLIGTIMA